MLSTSLFLHKVSPAATKEEPVTKKDFFSGLLAHAFKGLGLVWDAVNTSPIQRLPEEILTHIFSFLSPRDLKTCWFVNSQWHRCGLSSHLWRSFTLQEGRNILENDPSPHRTFYKFYPPRLAKKSYKPRQIHTSSLPAPSIFENVERGNRCIWRGPHFAASFGKEETIRIWDFLSEEILLEVYHFHRSFDISGPTLVTSSKEKDVVTFDTWSSSSAKRMSRKQQKATIADYIKFRVYKENLVVLRKTAVTLFERANLKEIVTIKPGAGLSSLATHETILACCNEMGNCTGWDTRSQEKAFEICFSAPSRIEVSFANDSLVATGRTSIQFWDLRYPEQYSFQIETSPHPCWDHHENVVAVAENFVDEDMMKINKSISVELWDTRSGQKMQSLYNSSFESAKVWDIHWVEDQLVLINQLNKRMVWDFNA